MSATTRREVALQLNRLVPSIPDELRVVPKFVDGQFHFEAEPRSLFARIWLYLTDLLERPLRGVCQDRNCMVGFNVRVAEAARRSTVKTIATLQAYACVSGESRRFRLPVGRLNLTRGRGYP